MKSIIRLALIVGCSLLAITSSQAQNLTKLKMAFKGTCMATNAAGKVVTVAISDRNWLIDFARDNGLKSLKNLAVAYHVGADEKGDQIEVINTKTGEVQGNVFGLFFSDSFGRTGLTNSAGTQTMMIQYVYTKQASHSLGTAAVTKTMPASNTSYAKVTGQIQYELLPTSFRKSIQICRGTFMTGRPFVFSTSP